MPSKGGLYTTFVFALILKGYKALTPPGVFR
jgi:hypothetical protein